MSRGNGPKGQLALDAEAQILPYYNDYFGTPFPLPKLDNVAGPGQSQFFGAMENWGAIFTFERILLDDPAITTERERQAIFASEAHEMAHQWFGDLVTMAWWDDLWLNEGFASWMENQGDRALPSRLGRRYRPRRLARRRDGPGRFHSTHPIVQQVRTVEQANQAFDTITYSKGRVRHFDARGLRRTPIVWRTGIQAYIRRHAYQNTRTTTCGPQWSGAGATGLTHDRERFHDPAGHSADHGRSLAMRGRPDRRRRSRRAQFSTIPRTDGRRKSAQLARPGPRHAPAAPSTQVVTNGRTTQLAAPGCGPLLINAGQTGYFRTLYTAGRRLQRSRAPSRARRRSTSMELLRDQLALSRAGYQPMARGLDFLAEVPANANAKVVAGSGRSWAGLYDDFDGNPAAQAAIAARRPQLYGPRLQQLGFAPQDAASPRPTRCFARR